MTPVECFAYAWNKGTGRTGQQLDRLLADKVGLMFSQPDNFDYDRFTANVTTLTGRYAHQAGASVNEINDLINKYYKK